MGVEQNDFRDMFSVYLSGPPQTQHVFCVSPAARVAHTGLAGEEWLKAFPLQAFQYGDGGNVRISFTAGSMPVFTENTGNIVHQFFVCQRTVTAYLVRIKVLAPGQKKAKTGRIWTYVRDDRNVGSSSPPAVWFAYSPNRQGKHPEQHLRPFRGILQADAFTGYDRLFSAEREGGALTEVVCWAHARRKIRDVYISSKSATAEEALKRISELYAI